MRAKDRENLELSIWHIEGIPSVTAAQLQEHSIETLRDLCSRTKASLLELPGVGRTGVRIIQEGLKDFGLALQES